MRGSEFVAVVEVFVFVEELSGDWRAPWSHPTTRSAKRRVVNEAVIRRCMGTGETPSRGKEKGEREKWVVWAEMPTAQMFSSTVLQA